MCCVLPDPPETVDQNRFFLYDKVPDSSPGRRHWVGDELWVSNTTRKRSPAEGRKKAWREEYEMPSRRLPVWIRMRSGALAEGRAHTGSAHGTQISSFALQKNNWIFYIPNGKSFKKLWYFSSSGGLTAFHQAQDLSALLSGCFPHFIWFCWMKISKKFEWRCWPLFKRILRSSSADDVLLGSVLFRGAESPQK